MVSIQLEFFSKKSNDYILVNVPEDSTAEDLAHIIRDRMHTYRDTLSEVYIDHIVRRK